MRMRRSVASVLSRRAVRMLAGGMFPGWWLLLAPVLPFNKNLWTPPYVLWTGGLAIIALLAAHRALVSDTAAAILRLVSRDLSRGTVTLGRD